MNSASTPTKFHAAVLETLAYYDCFDFPLTLRELSTLLTEPTPVAARDEVLSALVEQQAIEEVDSGSHRYFALNRTEDKGTASTGDAKTATAMVERREQGESNAATLWPTVAQRSRLIARFPFVEAVAISGSLSKGTYFSGDDVDFFLVTSAQRVWTCRLLLMLYKRIVLRGSRDLFCINYLVSETHLSIPDQNLFTATEIAWLVPMSGHSLLQRFVAANEWTGDHLPQLPTELDHADAPWRRPWHNSEARPAGSEQGKTAFVRLVESALGSFLGTPLEALSHWLIAKRNSGRYRSELSKDQYAQAMRAKSTVSKHHPRNQQERILLRFEQRCQQLRSRWLTSQRDE